MSLRGWERSGWLKKHKTSREEISDLFKVTDRDLADSSVEGLSPDAQLQHAYNAALQVAKAALAAAGYRAGREAHHYRTIQSLRFTIEAAPDLVSCLDSFRKKRNVGAYERAGSVSQQEAREMAKLARTLQKEVLTWIREFHPDLL